MSAFVKYRPDIDGLRSIAVGSVVLYHAGFGIVSGGFVGVDVFFVISGYLITLILAREISGNRFSLLGFYDRRVRRILPAYVLVALVTSVAAYFFLMPYMLDQYGANLISTAVFLSNFYFRTLAGYFGDASEQNLLLHTWSLSVEEQFYIFWPLMLYVLMLPVFAKWRRALLFISFTGSLGLASFAGFYRPEAAFYYSPLRAWELLLGALLSLRFFPAPRDKWREPAALLGLFLILVAAFFFGAADVPFPGLAALLPCGGAALIIWAGEDGGVTRTGKLLSSKPFVFVGLISYSLYLWHWPVIVVTKIYLDRPVEWWEGCILIALSVLLGWASWRFVEQRFKRRTPPTVRSQAKSVSVALASLLVLIGIGSVFLATEGFPGRTDASVLQAQTEMRTRWRGRDDCVMSVASFSLPRASRCRFGDADSKKASVMLWGDSHADHFAPALDEVGRDLGFSFLEYAKSSCSAAGDDVGLALDKGPRSCRLFREKVLKRILGSDAITTVVLGAYWSTAGVDVEPSLEKVVDTLVENGKNVVLVGPVPRFEKGGGGCIATMRFYHRDESACYVPAEEERTRLQGVTDMLWRVAGRSGDIHLVLPFETFCDDRWCRPEARGHVTYHDKHHLNVIGAGLVVPQFRAVFESFASGRE